MTSQRPRRTEFPSEPSFQEKALHVARIEHSSNRLVEQLGSHEDAAIKFRAAYVEQFGNHLDADRIRAAPGLSDEVRRELVRMVEEGASEPETSPRWDLRLTMNAKLAAEHGEQALDKIIKDGKAGRILLVSTLIEAVMSSRRMSTD